MSGERNGSGATDRRSPSTRDAPEPRSLGASSPFLLLEPQILSSGVVFSSPHSGRVYSPEFLEASRLDPTRLRASEDAYVDRLFAVAAEYGAPVLAAVAPRAFVDLNRCPSDLDPNLVDGAQTRTTNARVIAGLGVVPRIVAEGVAIYDGRISLDEAKRRIHEWHTPYHHRLVELMIRARKSFGRALLIDCHSMPTAATHPSGGGRRKGAVAEIVLGDRFGMSADVAYVDEIEAAFVDAGFRVARNAPFAGGYITERYGRPAAGVSAVQIEIDRALYLDQATVAPSAAFDSFRAALEPVIERICALVGAPNAQGLHSLAAE